MYGNLTIKPSFRVDLALYEFGISAVNETVPYIWQGQLAERDGKQAIVFTCLSTGFYWWFVRRKSDGVIVASQRADVSIKSIETYFFADTPISDDFVETYNWNKKDKKITLTPYHPLYNQRFKVISGNFNGFDVRVIQSGGINLVNYSEILVSNNEIDLSVMEMSYENICSITINFS